MGARRRRSRDFAFGINRHHNGTTSVVKDGKTIFAIEEERLNRWKYEGIPFLGIIQSKKFIKSGKDFKLTSKVSN